MAHSLSSGTEILVLFSPIYILSFHAFTHPLTTRHIITVSIRFFITINQHVLGLYISSCVEVFCMSSVYLYVSGFLLKLQKLNVISLSPLMNLTDLRALSSKEGRIKISFSLEIVTSYLLNSLSE